MTSQLGGPRLPGEWEPHEGTWFTWPHNEATWPKVLPAIERVLAGAVRALAGAEAVFINVLDEAHAQRTLDMIAAHGVQCVIAPSDDAWCRDHGAIFVKHEDGSRRALDFGFNAWGGKYPPWQRDAAVAAAMAAHVAIKCRRVDVVLEGGAVESNGQGVIMTTASCVLNANRNAQFNAEHAEALFAKELGARHVLWLGGELAGDDTDGHIDNLARFVSPSAVLVVAPDRIRNDSDRQLAKNLQLVELQSNRMELGLCVDQLPVPQDFHDRHGLPASYANFYVGNGVVLVPVYGDPMDDRACATIERCFPGRELIPVDCREVIVGLGALHCLTQPLPL